jgi:hypothetical protein
MSRAKRPLNNEAVKKADTEFHKNHPELNGKSLSGTDPKQVGLRKEWMALYKKNSGEIEKPNKKLSKSPKETITKCPSKKPTTKQVKEIQGLIDANKHQEAIDKAVEYYEVDISKVKGGKVNYDAGVSGAATSHDGTVKMGTGHWRSPGWLASSIAHETEVHVNKQAEKGNWYTDTDGTNLQECEAYDHEISNKERFGLIKNDVDELNKTRKGYYDGMSQTYKDQADKGIYTRP